MGVVLRWWIASVASVVAWPSPSEACSCNRVTDPEYVAASDVAFDGTVLGDAPKGPPKRCTEPSTVSVRPGCLEIGVFDPTACEEIEREGTLQREGSDDAERWKTTSASGGEAIVRAHVCKLATGTYTLDHYNGPPRTFSFDAKVGGSVMLYAPASYNAWRVRIRVDTPIKGDLPREVFLRSSGSGGGGCGIETAPAPGRRMRFFATRFDNDDDLGIDWCSGHHDIDDTTPKLPRIVTAAAAAPPPPPPPAPSAPAQSPRPSSRSGGCNAGGSPRGAAVLVGLVGLALARRRGLRA